MPKHATKTSFKKGNPGKQKGTKNKFTTLKQAFVEAFSRVGGEEALVAFYKNKKSPSNQRAFLMMIASMLPKDVVLSGNPDSPLSIKGVIEHATGKSGGVQKEVPASPDKLEG
jgi:coenzyme F420-reducing hydrogenase gamma subunit